MDQVPVAVVGASGYTGAELLRLLCDHPRVQITYLGAYKNAGQRITTLFPHLLGRPELDLPCNTFDADQIADSARVAFLALPHGESVPAAAALVERGVTVLDLSADFRLHDLGTYETWYGPHGAPALLDVSIYGLPELHRAELPGKRLIAVPGCYPTATLLALAPLLEMRLIEPQGLIVDAKSGVTGAGRTPSLGTHFSEIGEGIRAYKVAAHRHTPEIEQELSRIAGNPVTLTFTPHLIPMSRGILSTCYALPVERGLPQDAYQHALRSRYRGERFITVVDHPPDTSHVRGSNRVHVGAWYDARAGRVIAMGAIDNLVKGAAGQALQAMNVVLGFPEHLGLDAVGIFP